MKRLLAATMFTFFAMGSVSAAYACDCKKDKTECAKECANKKDHKDCKGGCKHGEETGKPAGEAAPK